MGRKKWKLCIEEEEKIVRLYKVGVRVVDIAAYVGISDGWVSEIAKRNGLTRMPQRNRPKVKQHVRTPR